MFNEASHETSNHEPTYKTSATKPNNNKLDTAIKKAQEKLLSLQDEQGFWVFELEADCTIPAEYIMMMHYLGEIDEPLQAKLANYLRSRQSKKVTTLYSNMEKVI